MTFSKDKNILKIQKIELEALKEVKEIATANDIHFFLRGGSVMGAVKYQGFVPWDDDTDIAVPRKDYSRLITLLSSEWSDKYWMASYLNGDEIHSYFPRVLLKPTYQDKLGLKSNNHLGFTIIDILPLDGVPASSFGRFFFKYEVMFFRLLGAVHTANYKDTISQHKGMRKKIISLLNRLHVEKMYSQNWTYDVLDKIYSSRMGNQSKWIGTITGSSFDKEIFPSEIWGRGIFLPFEDTTFRVPARWDDYLKQIYGENYALEVPRVKKTHQLK
ncbi:LicD family protein [Oenococcus oeni]|uniref:LicD family protein n=1 Tax=Oenococcus oeni TaxID=1247 RepID=UPI0010B002BA|nr:LicD family protein [Oenococcus oeni]SYW14868.1 LICD family protein [Oenococcus oeni]